MNDSKKEQNSNITEATGDDWIDFWEGDVEDDKFGKKLNQYGYEYTPKKD